MAGAGLRDGRRQKATSAPAVDRLAGLASTVVFVAGFAAFSTGAGQEGGNLARQLLWFSLCLLTVVFSLRESVTPRFVLPRWQTIVLLLPLLYAGASYAWSDDPQATMRRVVLFAILVIIAFAVFARGRGTERDFLRALNRPVALLMLAGLVATAAFPAYSITDEGWRGVASHKNEFGQVTAIGALLGVAAIVAGRRVLGLIAVAVCLALLVLSRSVTAAIGLTSALLLVGGASCFAGFSGRSREYRMLVLFLVMLCAATVHAVILFDLMPHPTELMKMALSSVGRSTTLTGRTGLWDLVLLNSRLHDPLIGGGYGSFWTGLSGVAGYVAWRFPGGYLGSAHNGYIDVFNETGYLGLAILCVFVMTHAWMLVRARHLSRAERFFHWAVLCFTLIVNASESSFWRGTHLLNIVMLMSYCRLLGLLDAGSTTQQPAPVSDRSRV